MRSTREIIEAFGAVRIARAIDIAPGAVGVWKYRDNIPPRYWRDLVAKNIATMDELLENAATPGARENV